MKRKTKSSRAKILARPTRTQCVMNCLRNPVEKLTTWHEMFLMALMAVSYLILKVFSDVILLPMVNSPLQDPMLVLEPFMILVFSLLLIQKFWKNGTLGFVLSMTICLSALVFMAIIMAVVASGTSMVFEYLVMALVPASMFAISISMGKKYQNCMNC